MNKKTGFFIILIIGLCAVGAFVVLRKFNPTILHYSESWGFEPTLQTVETAVVTAIQGSPGAVFTALSAAIGGIALAIRQVVSMRRRRVKPVKCWWSLTMRRNNGPLSAST
jgi:hypothetical protein